MSAQHPAEVAAFLEKHARSRLTFYGSIASYENDEHEVTFDWRSADSVLAGEDAFDDTKYVALGFLNGDLPLFVDLRKAAVFALMDGERVRIQPSFSSFVAKLEKPTPKATTKKPTASKKAPEPLPGPPSVAWADDAVVSCRFGETTDGKHFLWFDRVSPKANTEALLRYVKPQGFRTDFRVGGNWKEAASMTYDRGTGKLLDFSSFDRRTPVVTPRVRAFLLEAQPETLEFLPVRAKIGRITADLFIMNVTLAVPCLDTDAVELPDASVVFPLRMPGPRALTSNRQTLAVHAERAPSAPAFFRPAEYPEAILANRPMVDRLRGARFSGVDFVPLAQHAFL